MLAPAVARHDRTVRLETVKQALGASRRGVALKTLAERHGWPLRSLYRDVDALELSGHQVVREDGRFRIENPGPSSAGTPGPDERLALYLAREQARGWKHTSLGQALDRLWNRVSSAGDGQAALLPIESVPWITTREWASIDYGEHRRIVATLERAVRDRVAISARYRALSTHQVTSRVIEPGQLHWDPALETMYLVGWCRLRGDVRVFAVHRFLAVTLLEETCAPRAETRSKAALRNAFRVWRSAHVTAVRIWFSGDVAEEIRERRWLPAQQIEDAGGGAVVVSGEVAGLAEVQRWVLGYGAGARVLGPAGLVAAVAGGLRAAAAGYEGRRVGARGRAG
jgi:predicted DNA-binding transcriptional regulator YafY